MLKPLQLRYYIKMHTDGIGGKCSIWIESRSEYAVSVIRKDIVK